MYYLESIIIRFEGLLEVDQLSQFRAPVRILGLRDCILYVPPESSSIRKTNGTKPYEGHEIHLLVEQVIVLNEVTKSPAAAQCCEVLWFSVLNDAVQNLMRQIEKAVSHCFCCCCRSHRLIKMGKREEEEEWNGF